MKKCYIAHPLRLGDLEENRAKVSEICRKLPKDILPLSPIHNFIYQNPHEYNATHGMQLCFSLLALADELWVYGDYKKSEGCQAEMAFAWCRKIPIRIMGGE